MKYFAAILLFFCLNLTVSAQNDCPEALVICGNSGYSGLTATGVGVQELIGTNDCASAENNSVWLKLNIKTGGTLGFILTPNNVNLIVDFDFFIYGPNVPCDNIGHAVRCSTTNPLMAGSISNLTGMNETETDIAEGPGPDGNNFINWFTVQDDDVYYLVIDRPVGASDFAIEWTGTAAFHDVPVFNNPNNININLEKCDTDGSDDGVNVFNLATHAAMFLGSQTDVVLTFHENLNDVTTGTNPIINTASYINGSNPHTIFMRMTNTVTGCFSIEEFELIVHALPVFNNPQNISLNLTECDTDGVADGLFICDLTTHAAMLTGGDAALEITWHESLNDANTALNAISTPAAYTTGNRIVYMRLTNIITGCFSTRSFDVMINPVPLFNNPQNISLDFVVCDTDGINDLKHTFNLAQHSALLKGSQTDVALTFHEIENDAISGSNPIADIASYINTTPAQTIYIRMTNTVTGCHATHFFTITVNGLPVFTNPQNIALDIIMCDTDGTDDERHTFNLTQHSAMLIGTQPDIVLTYHKTITDAATGLDPIQNAGAFPNTTNPQEVYMRMANSATACVNTQPFSLRVNSIPVFNNPQNISLDLETCDTDGVPDHTFIFNLTQHAPMLTGSQANATITYHEQEADAIAGTAAIANPDAYANTTTPQDIFMRITSSANGCFSTLPFKINVHDLPVFNNPQNIPLKLEECDRDTADDKSFIFNLTAHAAMLVGAQAGVSITYHTDVNDAITGSNAIANPATFRNTVNPQMVFMRMTNTATECFSTGSFEIEVVEILDAGNPENLVLCDVNENGHQIFDLTLNNTAVKNGNVATFVRYYGSLSDAENEMNAHGSLYQNVVAYGPETVWARLENVGGCFGFDIKPFTLTVTPLPDIVFTTAIVDFTNHENSITINMADPENFEFSLDGLNYTDDTHFAHLDPGIYTVYIRAKNDCKIVSKEVVIMNYPKFFTPNGDGINDYWTVRYLFTQPKASISILDRYGKVITFFNGNSDGWNGIYNGKSLPATDYWFILELEDGRVIKGHFAMIR